MSNFMKPLLAVQPEIVGNGAATVAGSLRPMSAEVRGLGQMFRNHRTVLGLLAFWALIVVAWAMIGG